MPSSPLFSLEGQVALITGASRGIGASIATHFAAAGARVVLVARKREGLDEVAASIQKAGGEALAVAAHTGKPDEVRAAVAAGLERFGKLDILVNNAATNPYFGPLLDVSEPAWDKTFEVNLKGYFYTTREVAQHLQSRNAPGSIINVTSMVALRAAPMQGVYGMTKAAVISMTQTLAQELGGSGIRVNAIAPGLVETRFASTLLQNEDIHQHIINRTVLGRHAQPDEIAGAALFLASPAGSYVSGHTLVVDGGTTVTL
jgi:NAD(P)-dependent dehydrogenase (short-subunit alcohol dehydrogenase family)